MNVFSASLAGRACGSVWRWFAVAWRVSLIGRLAAVAGRAAAAGVAGSRLLSLSGASLCPLSTLAAPLRVPGFLGLTARMYVAVARGLGEGAVGRGLRRAAASWNESFLSGGSWLRVMGASLAAGGVVCAGRSSSGMEAVAAGLLAAAGLTAAAAPRLLVSGARPSLAGRLAVAGGLIAPVPPRTLIGSGSQEIAAAAVSGAGARVAVWAAAAVAAAAGGLSAAAGTDVFVLLVGAALLATMVVVVPYRAELLLLALAAFPWIDWLARNLLGPGLGGYWDEALLVCGLLAAAFSAVVLRRHEMRSVPATMPILVAVVLAIGSLVVNNVPDQVAQFALRVTFQPFLFYFLGVWLPKDRRWVKAAVIVFLCASLLLALHGLYQYLTNAPMPASWVDTHEDIGTRAYSIVNNPNGLGAFLLLGVMIAGSLTLSPIARAWRVVGAVLTAILLAALGVTFSRGAYIGLVAGFVAMVLLAFRPWLGRLAGAALVGALLIPRRFWDRLLFGFSSYYLQLSATNGRLYVWRIALLRMVEHPWWGVGLGTLGGTSAYLAGYGRLWIDSHYLQLGAEGGLLLLLAFLWILCRAGKGLVASFCGATDPMSRGIVAGVFGGFVAVCVAALTSSVWETLVVGAGFWFLAGMASSLPVRGEEAGELVAARSLGDEPPVGRLLGGSAHARREA